KSGINARQPLKAPDQQSCAYQHDDRQRDLSRDQQTTDLAPLASRRSVEAILQHLIEIDAGKLQGGQYPEKQPRQHGHSKGKDDRSGIIVEGFTSVIFSPSNSN